MGEYVSRDGGISVGFITKGDIVDSFFSNIVTDRFELIFFAAGKGSIKTENSQYSFLPRSLLFLSPMGYRFIETESDEYEIISVKFSKDDLPEAVLSLFEGMLDNDGGCCRFYNQMVISDSISYAFDSFSRVFGYPLEVRDPYLKMLLGEIVVMLSCTSCERGNSSEVDLGARVARYLNTHMEKNITLDNLAKKFFVSKYHLCRAFKEYSGVSVHSYINYKRIMYAKTMIEAGETAASAAFKVGFGDYSAFYRAYIKIVGNSPINDFNERNEK